MQNIKQIRQRIKAAKNIQQITRAMKLVAAARLKKAQEKALQARPYSDKMRELMGHIALSGELPDHPLLQKRPMSRYGVIVIASERGLCGSYNANILRKASETIAEHGKENADLIVVGKKAQQYFARREYNISSYFQIPNSGPTLQDAMNITHQAEAMFVSGAVDAFYIVYSKFVSPLVQIPTVVQLMPIEPPTLESSHSLDYTFEPEPIQLMSKLLPRYVLTVVYQALLEAFASQNGSQMTAMTSATDNAGKIIHELTLTANRVRQASITKEILEVVSGAEALNG